MTAVASHSTSCPRRRAPTQRAEAGAVAAWCSLGRPASRLTCVDGRLRGHDETMEFMAETQKLIGVSLEGSVG